MIWLIWLVFTLLVVTSIGAILFGLPYLPTISRDIRQVFDHLGIDKTSYVVDLGSGDGRVLVEAAKRGAKVSGVEINPFLVALSRFRLRKYPTFVGIKTGDLFKYQIPDGATHIFLFTNSRFMSKLEQGLVKRANELGGLTVVSYGFEFKDTSAKSRQLGPFMVYDL